MGLWAAWVAFASVSRSDELRSIAIGLDDLSRAHLGVTGFEATWEVWVPFTGFSLFGATVAAPFAMVVRAVARRRLRRGRRDMLELLRTELAEMSFWARVLTWLPAVLLTSLPVLQILLAGLDYGPGMSLREMAFFLALYAPAPLALTVFVRRSLSLLTRPPTRPGELTGLEASPDEIHFSAVAATPDATALVAAFALATLSALALLLGSPIGRLDVLGVPVVLGYSLLAVVTIAAFQRASRIVVGDDGVLVMGTSRRRFLAYRDVDAVEVTDLDILLRARGRGVLRLQLLGRDSWKTRDIGARVRAYVERAHADGERSAQRSVETAWAEDLARAARGQADYRVHAISRDDLLALVESPATTVATRIAVAEALAGAGDAGELETLREIGERCADPETRAAIQRVAASS